MCFGGTPKLPEQKDPVLPKQALQQTQPVGLQLRGETKDDFAQTKKKNRNRGKLRIEKKDNTGVQISGKGGGGSFGGGGATGGY